MTISQGQVEYKARSILETLYSMRNIKLLPGFLTRSGIKGAACCTCVNAKELERVEAVVGIYLLPIVLWHSLLELWTFGLYRFATFLMTECQNTIACI